MWSNIVYGPLDCSGLVTLCNPEATQEAWGEFCLQRQLSRVEDVALVEEWFFVHGFRSEN